MLSPGTRLGREERRLLLEAAPRGDGGGHAILPSSATPSSQVATRRAVASLCEKGLIEVVAPNVRAVNPGLLRALNRNRPNSYVKLRYMRRTELGDRVVDRYRSELERGSRIRWRV